MKVFTTSQIAIIDKYTIENEPIKSIDLMERAASNLACEIRNYIHDEFENLVFICGHGNNGGDGLAIARKLHKLRMVNIKVYLFAQEDKLSDDCAKNWKRLKKIKKLEKYITFNPDDVTIDENSCVIDALFGNGLTRPLGEPYKTLIKKINNSGARIISIDIPSGLMGEDNSNNDTDAIVKADKVFTIEFPKLSFFFPENEDYVKDFDIVSISLNEKIKNELESPYYYIYYDSIIKPLLRKRRKFAEKRDFGHALLIAGSYEKPGCAILAAKACLRSGVGLLHVHIPKNCILPVISNLPDVMLSIDNNDNYFTSVSIDNMFTAVGIGPGIGTEVETVKAFNKVLENVKEKNLPLIIDADGLNILSKNKELLNILPKNTILTPHSREFDRLFGIHDTHYKRFLTAREVSNKYGIIIVLKGAHTQIHTPEGYTYFNSTGTPAMAKAGTGDVLTGIILSFLAQKYNPVDAAILGVYFHGLAGEEAKIIYSKGYKESEYSILASDIIDNIFIR